MVWQTPIATGIEGFFWFVVVLVVIISKIVQAGKKNAAPSPRKSSLPDATDTSPEEELRDFLKRLSQGVEEPEPPPPLPRPQRPVARPATPPPLPAQTARTTHSSQSGAMRPKPVRQQPPPRARPSPPPATHAPVIPAAPPPAPVAVPTVAETPPVPAVMRAAAVAAPVNKQREAIIADLKNRDCLREVILLREILGPPLAMRRQTSDAFIG